MGCQVSFITINMHIDQRPADQLSLINSLWSHYYTISCTVSFYFYQTDEDQCHTEWGSFHYLLNCPPEYVSASITKVLFIEAVSKVLHQLGQYSVYVLNKDLLIESTNHTAGWRFVWSLSLSNWTSAPNPKMVAGILPKQNQDVHTLLQYNHLQKLVHDWQCVWDHSIHPNRQVT